MAGIGAALSRVDTTMNARTIATIQVTTCKRLSAFDITVTSSLLEGKSQTLGGGPKDRSRPPAPPSGCS